MLHESGDYGKLSTGQTKLSFASVEPMEQMGKSVACPSDAGDVAAAVDRAVAEGATLVEAAHVKPWGQTIAYVRDPNGFLIEVCTPVQTAT